MVTQVKPDFYKRWEHGPDKITARFLFGPMYEYKEKSMATVEEKTEVKKYQLEQLNSVTKQVMAIELLEYHNKNHLAFDNHVRISNKVALLAQAINILSFYVKRDITT